MTSRLAEEPRTKRDHDQFRRGLSPPKLSDDSRIPFHHFDECFVSGRMNPCSFLMEPVLSSQGVSAKVTLTQLHEGAIGRAHGGAIAAVYDDFLGYVVGQYVDASYMVHLEVDFLQATPVSRPIHFEGRLTKKKGRKHWVEGRSYIDGAVTTRGHGLAIAVAPQEFTPLS